MSIDLLKELAQIKTELEQDPDCLKKDEQKVLEEIIRIERVCRNISNPTDKKDRLEQIRIIINKKMEG
ncbi:hypothetical protein AAEH72_05900 [Shewanella xiamenensis]|uniref:hypothetical protein n=1 Tax=Shewanella xiamenensis TaxID=332186 RepID=UPI00313CDF71